MLNPSLLSIHRGFTRGKIVSIGQYPSGLRDRAESINIVTRQSDEILAGGAKLSAMCESIAAPRKFLFAELLP